MFAYLAGIEPQVFFFLEKVLTRLLFGREFIACHFENPVQSANGRNIADQQVETTLSVFQDVTCCVRLLALLHVVACCWELLHRLHTTATRTQQHATLFNIVVGAKMLAVVVPSNARKFGMGFLGGCYFWSRDFLGGWGGGCRKP